MSSGYTVVTKKRSATPASVIGETKLAEVHRYRATSSGLPIKFMTLGLLTLTTFFAYDLYKKKAYPHQHGHQLSDLFKDADGNNRLLKEGKAEPTKS